ELEQGAAVSFCDGSLVGAVIDGDRRRHGRILGGSVLFAQNALQAVEIHLYGIGPSAYPGETGGAQVGAQQLAGVHATRARLVGDCRGWMTAAASGNRLEPQLCTVLTALDRIPAAEALVTHVYAHTGVAGNEFIDTLLGLVAPAARRVDMRELPSLPVPHAAVKQLLLREIEAQEEVGILSLGLTRSISGRDWAARQWSRDFVWGVTKYLRGARLVQRLWLSTVSGSQSRSF
ncbi:unnamed protein product, partial [Amoebophrya sp. A120]